MSKSREIVAGGSIRSAVAFFFLLFHFRLSQSDPFGIIFFFLFHLSIAHEMSKKAFRSQKPEVRNRMSEVRKRLTITRITPLASDL